MGEIKVVEPGKDFNDVLREASKTTRRGGSRTPQNPQPRPTPSNADSTGDEKPDDAMPMDVVLGRETFNWCSPFNKNVQAKFRRARGGTNEMIARVLGPQQADNQQLIRQYRALASVTEINGREIPQPNTTAKFSALAHQIGEGPDGEFYDEPLTMFIAAYEFAMFPELMVAMEEVEASGLSPGDAQRIASGAGLVRVKK